MPLRRAALSTLAATAVLALAPTTLNADCALIPPAVKPLLSSDGGVDRPFAAPGDVVTIFSDSSCKIGSTQPHFSTVAANNEITLLFQPPTGGSVPAITIVPDDVGDCGDDRCFALTFTMPDTSGDPGTDPGDDFPFTGPARLEVRNNAPGVGGTLVAVVDELFEPARGCNPDNRERNLFRHFTVLPPRNVFPAAGVQTLDAAVDGTGALLIPFDFDTVLVETPGGTGTLRLLKVSADLPNGLTGAQKDLVLGPGHPDRDFIRLPQAGGYARAFFFNGRRIPPLLEITSSGGLTAADTAAGAGIDFGDQIVGSVDFIESVIRLANTGDPGVGSLQIFEVGGPGGLDLATATTPNPGVSGPVGPVRLSAVSLGAGATAPLNSLNASQRVAAVARDEQLEAVVAGGVPNQNADGDQDDKVVEFTDLASGAVISTGQAVLEIDGKAVLEARGDTVAFLQSEAHQTDTAAARMALNGDDDARDGILRVWTADGSHPSCGGSPCELTSTAIAVDPTLAIQGPTGTPEPVVISGPPGDEGRYVWFGASEIANSPANTLRVSVDRFGSELTQEARLPYMSGDGTHVSFVSADPALALPSGGYYRVESPGGAIHQYPSFTDFINDTNAKIHPTLPAYADDADFFFDSSRARFVGVDDAGATNDYATFFGFLRDTGATSFATPALYAGDGFFYDSAQDKYYRIDSGGAVLEYPDFTGLSTDPFTFLNQGVVPAYGDDAGFFYDADRSSYFRIDDTGGITEYATFAGFTTDTGGTFHGTPAGGAYGDDAGFLHAPIIPFVSRNAYVLDLRTGTNELLSMNDAGQPSNNDSGSWYPGLSRDGQIAVFQSVATNLASPLSGLQDLYVRDRAAGTTVRVTEDPGGGPSNNSNLTGFVSADGGTVVYASLATNLVSPPVTPGFTHVYAYDVASQTNEHIGRTNSGLVSVSEDGNLVAFSSFISGVVGVYLHDRAAGTTELMSVGFGGAEPDSPSSSPSMSADGRFVAFFSQATNLLPPDSTALDPPAVARQCYVRDRLKGVTALVSRNLAGKGADANCDAATISPDGRYVTFASRATNLFPGATGSVNAMYLHDRRTGITTLVSRGGLAAPGAFATGQLSPAGVAEDVVIPFEYAGADLGVADTNAVRDIYLYTSTPAVSYNTASPWLDGDSNDTVLHVFDTQTGTLQNTGIPIATGSAAYTFAETLLDNTTGSADSVFLGPQGPSSAGLPVNSFFTHDFEGLRVVDRPGVDLEVFEEGPGGLAEFEKIDVLVSLDGVDFRSVKSSEAPGSDANARTYDLAGSGIPRARYVRILAVAEGGAGGQFDADALAAIHVDPDPFASNAMVAVAGSRAAVGNDQRGDVVVWDAASGTSVVRQTAPSSGGSGPAGLAMSETILCGFLRPPSNQVFVGSPAAGGALTVVADQADQVAANGDQCVFRDLATQELRYSDSLTLALTTDTGETVEDFQLGAEGIAFRSCESLEGDLNQDTDTADCAMRFWYYDPPPIPLTQLVETEQVAIPCVFPGCDPFFEPYRTGPGYVSFVTSEPDEVDAAGGGSPATGASCLPTSPTGVCDKTGDGDGDDVAVQIYNLRSGKTQTFPIAVSNPPTVAPFPQPVGGGGAGNVMAIQVPAAIAGDAFSGLPPDQLVTLIVGDPDGDFVFEFDGNPDPGTSVTDLCQETPDPDQLDEDRDLIGAACDFELDTANPNDDPVTAPAPAQIPGDMPCNLDRSGFITRQEVDQIWADRGLPIDQPFDRDGDMDLDPADDRDRDADGAITAADYQLCLADCSAQPVGCPNGGYKVCGLLGFEVLPLLLAPWLRARRRSRR